MGGMYFNCEEFDYDGGDCEDASTDSPCDDNSCYGYNCDFWADYDYSCSTLENTYGCSCSSCSCIHDDDGDWGMYFNCEEFDYDGGDCGGDCDDGCTDDE